VEGVPPKDIEKHPRGKKSVIRSFIRDKIKTLRAGGFGDNNPAKQCEEEKDEEEFMSNLNIYAAPV